MTATAYIRKSSLPGRGTASVSFEMQERAVRELAARHGDELPATIRTDAGRSGGSTRRRPEYQAMLAEIEAGEIDTIYSYSLSRLSRSVLDFAELLERCRRRGVRIRLAQEGEIDYRTATGRAYASMAAVFAAMERELAGERMASAVAERRQRGDVMGQSPYGYTIRNGKLVKRADEPLDTVWAAYRQARSFGGTARLLNAQKVRLGTVALGPTALSRTSSAGPRHPTGRCHRSGSDPGHPPAPPPSSPDCCSADAARS